MNRIIFFGMLAAAAVLILALAIDPDTVVDLVSGRLEMRPHMLPTARRLHLLDDLDECVRLAAAIDSAILGLPVQGRLPEKAKGGIARLFEDLIAKLEALGELESH
jgi:hypothetical protein